MSNCCNDKNEILIENAEFCLRVGADAITRSLIHKPTGEECLVPDADLPLFSVTQDRPYNNEIKLAHPNKRTTFRANRLCREGDRLIVGFELIAYEAVVEIAEKEDYISFRLADFIIPKGTFEGAEFTKPPVASFRLLQLPVKHRECFGEWLNVAWDQRVAINLLATSPYEHIEGERRKDYRLMSADAVRGIKMRGCEAALIVTPPDRLLDRIDRLEKDYGLPRGVERRRSPDINASIFAPMKMDPNRIDEYIAYAKKGGFRMMLIYYTGIVKEEWYWHSGDYDLRDEYVNGYDDLKAMLDKIRAAGIKPGFHFLHPHIGLKSSYVTPVADHRLAIKRYFTLARPLTAEDTTVYVEQNPEDAPMYENRRVLKFDGELIQYESYTTEPPYRFLGCKRGYADTNVIPHALGCIGGILDISEFGGVSCHVDQSTSLQDEVAEKIKKVYDQGMEFIYFDGSEATQPPFDFTVPYAQYRVYRKMGKEPILCEGAAKAHFSWHMLSGGNAFDVFPTDVFKQKIVEFPFEEAPRMAEDFTRVNFGWWEYRLDTQPDIFEYGTALAAAWDCPATVQMRLEELGENPRTDDILEVMRRWEDVRQKNWLTPAQKEMLKNTAQEHTLLINEQGEYELLPYDAVKDAAGGAEAVSAFVFERGGKSYVTCWHKTGEGRLCLNANAADFTYEREIGGPQIAITQEGDKAVLPLGPRAYLSTALSREELVALIKNATLIEKA